MIPFRGNGIIMAWVLTRLEMHWFEIEIELNIFSAPSKSMDLVKKTTLNVNRYLSYIVISTSSYDTSDADVSLVV